MEDPPLYTTCILSQSAVAAAVTGGDGSGGGGGGGGGSGDAVVVVIAIIGSGVVAVFLSLLLLLMLLSLLLVMTVVVLHFIKQRHLKMILSPPLPQPIPFGFAVSQKATKSVPGLLPERTHWPDSVTKLRCRTQSSVSWTLSTAFHDRGLESRRQGEEGARG